MADTEKLVLNGKTYDIEIEVLQRLAASDFRIAEFAQMFLNKADNEVETNLHE